MNTAGPWHRAMSSWPLCVERWRKQSAADAAFRRALRVGRLVRPTECSACGEAKPRIAGHHPDYDKPLEVVWLCMQCHGKRHIEERVKAHHGGWDDDQP